MIEIQCTSCNTRYRIDERVLPDDTPTFKCSRCGHVFNADPVPAKVRKPAPPAAESESEPPRTIRPARPRPSPLKSQVESDVVKREAVAEPRPTIAQQPEGRVQRSVLEQRASVEPRKPEPTTTIPTAPQPPVRVQRPEPSPRASVEPRKPEPPPPAAPEVPPTKDEREPEVDDPLNRTFGDREQKADTGENLKFDFSEERNQTHDESAEQDLERPEPDDADWQVGDSPADFEHAPRRQGPGMMAEPEPAARPTPPAARRMASTLSAEAPRFAQASAGPAKTPGFQLGHVAEESADTAPAGPTHASGFFLAMFFFVAIAFFGASALICGEPAASARILSQAPGISGYFARPIVPAMMVALHDVRAEYYTLKGGHVALMITGIAQNVSRRPLHLVEIDGGLIGSGPRPLAGQSVYVGNELSATMLGEMTPREIEFSQGLSPQKAFAMEPSASAPFLMVFIDPPAGAGKIRISVSKAVATAIPDPASSS